MTHLILDTERFTIAFGGAYFCNGSHRPFVIDLYDRGRGGKGVSKRRASLTLPLLTFRTAYRFRRVGGLRLWGRQGRIMHFCFCTRPH